MSQASYVMDSAQGGAPYTVDLNAALAAILTQNSGATAPSSTAAGMWWVDTANHKLKIRDESNAAWNTVLDLRNLGNLPYIAAGDAYKLLGVASDESGFASAALPALAGRAADHNVAGSSTTTLSAAEYGCPVINLTGAVTGNHDVVFPAVAGKWVVRNASTGNYTLTLKPSGGSGITMKLGERSHIVVVSDGSTLRELSRMQQFVGSVDVDLTLTGAQSVTGVGFRPVAGIFIAARASAAGEFSVGAANISAARLVADRNQVTADTWSTGAGSTGLVYYMIQGAVQAYASLSSFDADGFTFSRYKNGITTGFATVNFILFAS